MINEAEWVYSQLSEIIKKITNGYVGPTRGIYIEKGVPYILAKHVKNNKLKFNGGPFVSKEFTAKHAKSILKARDVLLVQSGHVGEAAVVKGEHEGYNCHALIIISPIPEKLDSDFLSAYFNSPIGRQELKRIETGATIRHLNCKTVKSIKIPLPPLPEQKRIAAILGKADAIRRKRRQAIKLADDFLRATFLDMFGDPVTNPKGWERSSLEELIKVKSGNFLPANKMREGSIPVYGGNGINGYHDEHMFENPMLVIGRVGAYCGAVHKTQTKSWITDNALYVAEKSDALTDLYLEWSLRMANLNQYSSQAGQPLISGGRIYPVEINLPPIELQKEFKKVQMTHSKMKEKILKASHTKENLFNSLTQRAFQGEL